MKSLFPNNVLRNAQRNLIPRATQSLLIGYLHLSRLGQLSAVSRCSAAHQLTGSVIITADAGVVNGTAGRGRHRGRDSCTVAETRIRGGIFVYIAQVCQLHFIARHRQTHQTPQVELPGVQFTD